MVRAGFTKPKVKVEASSSFPVWSQPDFHSNRKTACPRCPHSNFSTNLVSTGDNPQGTGDILTFLKKKFKPGDTKPKCPRGHFRCPQGDIYFSQLCTKGDRGTILLVLTFGFVNPARNGPNAHWSRQRRRWCGPKQGRGGAGGRRGSSCGCVMQRFGRKVPTGNWVEEVICETTRRKRMSVLVF